MVINTRDFGELTINESDIINFPLGLYGFEDLKRFVLLNDENSDNDDKSILWLQAVDNAFPCLVVLNPADFWTLQLTHCDLGGFLFLTVLCLAFLI